MTENEKVIGFRPAAAQELSDEEQGRRVMAEATRLTNLSPGEWKLWIGKSAERLAVPRADLEGLVKVILKHKERTERDAKAEDRRRQQRVAKQRAEAQREKQREQERERRRLAKDAERKNKEKQKAFAVLIKLPSDRHATKLAELAKRLDQDLVAVRAEFADFCAAESCATPIAEWAVERWREPVATAALLQELIDKIGKHIVARPHEILAIALWLTMAWVHESAATHSAFLVATSAEPDSGKTTLLGVLGFLLPKPFAGAEPTGPSIYRFIDREKPTLIVDEADDLFARKTDVKHIFNASWTRGTKIPRQVQGVTHWFDPFCPKVVGLLGMNLPRTLVGRSIVIKLWPKRPDEKVENFCHADDQEFANLRRKLARWAADNAAALKDATPLMPANFRNRLAANWRLPFAIAELAGGVWPKPARQAAERLSRTTRTPSLGLQLLAAIRDMFAIGRMEITSQQVVNDLNADPDGIWREYRGKSPITQRQVADLLEQYDIRPVVVHPTKRKDLSRHGYKSEQFVEAFQRFLPPIRTSEHRSRTSKARN